MNKLDANFFKPFVDGTLKTLKIQCQIEATPEKPYIKGSMAQPIFELAAVIGITSDAFSGSITLCFPEKLFLTLMSNMIGETFTTITEELQSGAGELLNIIFGTAKVVLNKQGFTIQKALPTVIRGADLQTTHMGPGPVMVLPFKTIAGDFFIEISTENGALA